MNNPPPPLTFRFQSPSTSTRPSPSRPSSSVSSPAVSHPHGEQAAETPTVAWPSLARSSPLPPDPQVARDLQTQSLKKNPVFHLLKVYKKTLSLYIYRYRLCQV